MISFNITTHVSGLRGQLHVYGRFDTQKKAIEALDLSYSFFKRYASIGALGHVGKVLVAKHGMNVLIATDTKFGYSDRAGRIIRPIPYWVQIKHGEWEALAYIPVEDKEEVNV